MMKMTIDVDDAHRVSGLLQAPPRARACYVLAHGAGAGMTHPFMAAVADGTRRARHRDLRYQFPYMEQRSGGPTRPSSRRRPCGRRSTEAAALRPNLPLFAGGKSFGGRMTSQAQAASPLPGVRGLVFLGFPLHPAGRPSDERAAHLSDVQVPMLFLQGTRDELADLALLRPLMRAARHARDLAAVAGGRSFLPRARAHAGARTPTCAAKCLTGLRPGPCR